ncbi:MAG: DUF4244 domain-containing protein [Ramlibacter sp.]|nr:DUF4244 domain-containing protein [Cryobacterium sp.]
MPTTDPTNPTGRTDPTDPTGTPIRSPHAGSPARPPRLVRAWRRRRNETGAATAEYAVATMAAVGFAGLLIVILRGDEVRGILTDLVRNALTVG